MCVCVCVRACMRACVRACVIVALQFGLQGSVGRPHIFSCGFVKGGIFVERALWFVLLDHRGRLVRLPALVCSVYDCSVSLMACLQLLSSLTFAAQRQRKLFVQLNICPATLTDKCYRKKPNQTNKQTFDTLSKALDKSAKGFS